MPAAGLSLNLATVRKQWSMREAVDGAARHGFAGVAPWRDMVAEIGTAAAILGFCEKLPACIADYFITGDGGRTTQS